ncbi:MAG: GAF domain-containing protein [Chloroflexota bacterium]
MVSTTNSNTLRFLQQENRRLQDENDQLREQVSRLLGYMDALRDLQRSATLISTADDVMAVLNQILYAALTVTDSSAGSLLLCDPETNELVFAVVHGERREVIQGYRLPAGTGVAGWAATQQGAVIVNDPRRDWRFSALVDETFGFQTYNLVALPLIARGRVLGVLEVLNTFSQDDYTEGHLNLLNLLALLAATALDSLEVAEE